MVAQRYIPTSGTRTEADIGPDEILVWPDDIFLIKFKTTPLVVAQRGSLRLAVNTRAMADTHEDDEDTQKDT